MRGLRRYQQGGSERCAAQASSSALDRAGREPHENFLGRRSSTLAGSAGEEMMKYVWLMGMVLTLALSGVASAADSPTFSDEVVRIVQDRCQACHRPGEHAPFSLIT
jgi:hypothetical protein